MFERANWKKTLLAGLVGLALAGPAVHARAEAKGDKKATKDTKKAVQTVDMKVTEKGFEPEHVSVKKGEPVTLIITRLTDKTCATEIIIDELGINTKLPLNEAVKVTFTPKKAGDLAYGCAMGKMIGGVLRVQ